jgi:hypothetical protein
MIYRPTIGESFLGANDEDDEDDDDGSCDDGDERESLVKLVGATHMVRAVVPNDTLVDVDVDADDVETEGRGRGMATADDDNDDNCFKSFSCDARACNKATAFLCLIFVNAAVAASKSSVGPDKVDDMLDARSSIQFYDFCSGDMGHC